MGAEEDLAILQIVHLILIKEEDTNGHQAIMLDHSVKFVERMGI